MIIGVGIDLLNIDRVGRLLRQASGERFIERVLTPGERELLEKRLGVSIPEAMAAWHEASSAGQAAAPRTGRLTEFVAGRFAAKEAVVKALGCGVGKAVGFQDIEVLPDALGKPEVRLSAAASERLAFGAGFRIHLSITHSRDTAGAYAVAERID
ncbi:holo-ACP synthase [Paenibacillus sp. MBLB4367]|uniref:holo-ACP synthase n=1 Tax=Paenibacillus sp. MBLB4367 TaxID=3384767 RepID=UPI003908248C